jgi:hypothetical protein
LTALVVENVRFFLARVAAITTLSMQYFHPVPETEK